MTSKLAADGTLADSQRRLQCVATNAGGCTQPGSCSAAPIERALVRYCSDLVNLQALYDGDRARIPKAELAAAEARQAKVEQQLDRITEALLASDEQPATFLRRARELEAELDTCRRQVAAAQQGVQDALRADMTGVDRQWRDLAKGVEALDYTARMRARELVADTFSQIVVYRKGIRPKKTPAGVIEMVLTAKGGRCRMLSVSRVGDVLAAEDLAGP